MAKPRSPSIYGPGTKVCNRCKRSLPLKSFYKRIRSPDGHDTVCCSCVRQTPQLSAPVMEQMWRTFWTEERKAQFAHLWDEGMPDKDIEAIMSFPNLWNDMAQRAAYQFLPRAKWVRLCTRKRALRKVPSGLYLQEIEKEAVFSKAALPSFHPLTWGQYDQIVRHH